MIGKPNRWLLLFTSALLFTASAWAEKWKIATLEWPPYTCLRCPDQGAGIKATREALKSVGIEVEFEFLPWVRAINEGGHPEYVGYFPAWPEEVKAEFKAGPALFTSPLGFIFQKDLKIDLKHISDLKGRIISGVSGYGYTDEFLKLAKENFFKWSLAYSDAQNIKSVANKRVEGAIIDKINAKYFFRNDFANESKVLVISDFVLANKNLLISLNKHHVKSTLPKLTEAVKKVPTQKIVDEWLKKNLL